jgi:hypothetical protein
MAVKKRPAPKLLTKPEKLVRWLLDSLSLPEIVKPHDVQRLEWLKVIAEERGILEPRRGLYNGDWVFELAYVLAVEMYDGSGRKGRPSAAPKDDMALIFKVREMRRKHPNDSQSKTAARVLGISTKQIAKKEHPENYKKVDALCKRYMKAEARLADKFTK